MASLPSRNVLLAQLLGRLQGPLQGFHGVLNAHLQNLAGALDQIAKSIIFRGEASGHVRLFLTAGGNRVDPAKAAALAGEPLGKADAATVRAETGFAIGGVAPLGHRAPVAAWWDPRLSGFPLVWAAAGTPRHVFAIAPETLLRITGAQVAAFTT